MKKDKAIKAAKNYCRAHDLSLIKLEERKVCWTKETFYFLAFPDIEPDGLRNDLETRGFPVLIVDRDYSVHETAETRNYL